MLWSTHKIRLILCTIEHQDKYTAAAVQTIHCVCVHTQHPSYIFHVSAADVSDLVCTYLLNATLNFKSDAYVP